MRDWRHRAGRSRRLRVGSALIGSALLIIGLIATSPGAAAARRPESAGATRNQASSVGYLTVIIGRAQLSKAIGCKTPANFVTLDEAAPQLAALGVHLTVAVVPARTGATTSDCVKGALYPSWADLTSLAAHDGVTVISASEDYEYMTTLTQTNQFAQSCGSLATFISHGFHRAWGLFAYPDNYYSSAIQAAVVQNCFAFGRTYINPHSVSGAAATNSEATTEAPWLQKTNDISGGRCNLKGKPCSTEGPTSVGRYLSPLTLHALTAVAPGTWTSVQAYTFVTGSSSSGALQWNCNDPTGNIAVDWTSHWTSAYEIYCWNDFLYAMTGISPSVVVTDPATVAQAWGRIPTPLVTIASVNPGTLNSPTGSTALTWSAEENGTYSVLAGGTDCSSGTIVAGGSYTTSPATIVTSVPASSFAPGANPLRVCLTNDPGHVGSATTSVTLVPGPTVTSVAPGYLPLAGGVGITVAGTGFTSGATVTVGGAAATSVDVVSSTEITATAPAAPGGASGPDDVVIAEASGTSATSAADQVTYDAAPSVTGIGPSAGPVSGGTVVTINGTGFGADATVTVGGLPATLAGPISPTTITATVPASAGDNPGTADIVVSDAGGASPIVTADEFNYEGVPSVTGVTPPSGSVLGGYDIDVGGTDFSPDATVTVCDQPATIDGPISSTSITVLVPEAQLDLPATCDVVVTDAGGTSPITAADEFTYTIP
jgi:hypothetical protein